MYNCIPNTFMIAMYDFARHQKDIVQFVSQAIIILLQYYNWILKFDMLHKL